MVVIAKKIGIFRDKIKVVALKDEKCEFDSFLGPRIWWINKGKTVTLVVSKSKMIEIGDILGFPYCVIKDWKIIGGHQIRWYWSC
jgi:hypothetical protein